MKKKADRCAVCNGFKPPSGWKEHARFPGTFLCSKVCVDTAGAGGSATESVAAVAKADPNDPVAVAQMEQRHALADERLAGRMARPAFGKKADPGLPAVLRGKPPVEEVRVPSEETMSPNVKPGENAKGKLG